MLTRLSIEVDRDELEELRYVLEKLTKDVDNVEIKLNPRIRSISRLIIREIDRWEDFKKEKW
ncbi:MAG: hypothetical protein DRP92_07750 [Candidatus Neomarinimicrobiota bacterium]|nr:hypothetical protein [Candidatus Neomarinimicrobiota bacterium]MCD6100822.1 hypothetical protein [Candidatus Neomarinimicrobiota bacterium]RKY46743.1 MAG: hypothetical protein DRP88_05960 [Candidatus Neomarinimicrobiota bacterium]RKY50645.1 MAG: hypothetical protein DRP92_07750 [Candidatus Neomarinimicrobiota bacterium]